MPAFRRGKARGRAEGAERGRQRADEEADRRAPEGAAAPQTSGAPEEAAAPRTSGPQAGGRSYTDELPNGRPGYLLPEDERSLSCVGVDAQTGECVGD